MAVTISRLYDRYADAERAVTALESAGKGAGIGAGLGGAAGLLAGLGLLAIPGLGCRYGRYHRRTY